MEKEKILEDLQIIPGVGKSSQMIFIAVYFASNDEYDKEKPK